MFTSDFNYTLPPELIAQSPASPRDSSRLMVVDADHRTIEHRHFYDIVDQLHRGDVLVWNNSKVFKARLFGTLELDEASSSLPRKVTSSDVLLNEKKVEVFLIRPMENEGVWKVLAKPGRKLRLGMKVVFAQDFSAEVLLKESDGTFLLQFNDNDTVVRAKANVYGEVPTPPYIKSEKLKVESESLEKRYQTVYAKREGSVAAPTAGFHFTEELIEKLKAKGVEFAEVTLHVGLGTFLPVKTERVEDHKMHSEVVELTDRNADIINTAKREGRRVIAVGTTTVRTLEGIVAKVESSNIKVQNGNILQPFSGELNIFITPGFTFQVIDALITNFHLPESTLLMLVAAFMRDREFALYCYEQAVKERYRFYSFGDAMFIS